MKQKKIKVIAMVLSLFAACSGVLSAMETSKSEKNSKMNLKSDQNNNKTENNKPQSDSKSNRNIDVQIPYYAYPMGYLGLNEIGGLLGFNYLLFGKYGIIKGAKHLLYDEKVEDEKGEIKIKDEIKIKAEVEKGPYWQYNLSIIKDDKTHNYPLDKSEVIKVLERIMDYTNESFLLELTGITKAYTHKNSPNNKHGEGIDSNFGDKKTPYSISGVETKQLTDEIKGNFGVSKGNSWVEKFFDDLRGNKKIIKAGRECGGCIYFKFDGDSFYYEVIFFNGGIFDDYYRTHTTMPEDYRMHVCKIGKINEIEVRFRVPTWLYSN